MADKNIQMTQRNTNNTEWDNLFPKTKIENVEGFLDKFTSLNSLTGYQKLPSGIIIQWGIGTVPLSSGKGQITLAFPIAFPNSAKSFANIEKLDGSSAYAGSGTIGAYNDKNGVVIRIVDSITTASSSNINWLAIGY